MANANLIPKRITMFGIELEVAKLDIGTGNYSTVNYEPMYPKLNNNFSGVNIDFNTPEQVKEKLKAYGAEFESEDA